MKIILNVLLSTLAVIVAANLLPGVQVQSFTSALFIAIVLGLVNAVIKPVLTVLTLPLNVLTLGLFSFIINGLMVLLVEQVVPGFYVNGFLNAVIFGVLLSILGTFFSLLK